MLIDVDGLLEGRDKAFVDSTARQMQAIGIQTEVRLAICDKSMVGSEVVGVVEDRRDSGSLSILVQHRKDAFTCFKVRKQTGFVQGRIDYKVDDQVVAVNPSMKEEDRNFGDFFLIVNKQNS